MQISPASTHSHQLRDPLAGDHMLTFQAVCDVRNSSDLEPCFWACKEKTLSNAVDLWNCT